MKIGILSDTHGDVSRTRLAIELLVSQGVTAVCHCGDVGSEQVLTELAAAFSPSGVPVYAVLGNVDHWEPGVREFPTGTGVKVCGRRAELELGGRKLVVVHGDDPRLLFEVVRSQLHDYCLTGHTHLADDFLEGRTRVINPGAVHRAQTPSVAVLDLAKDKLQVLPLRR
jgi:putative phosphoesterase